MDKNAKARKSGAKAGLDSLAERREAQRFLTDLKAKMREDALERAKRATKLTEEQIAKSRIGTGELELWAGALRQQIKGLEEKRMGDVYTIGMKAELIVVEREIEKRKK